MTDDNCQGIQYCPQCGVRLESPIRFCPQCGTTLPAGPAFDSSSDPTPQKKPRKKIVAITSAVIILVALIAAIGYHFYDQGQRELFAKEHRSYRVIVNINIEGYDPNTASPIPLLIDGRDFEGNQIAEHFLFKGNELTPIELVRGTYTISVSSSPVLADGTVFATENAASMIEVVDPESNDYPDGTEASTQANATQILTLTPIDPSAISDEQLRAIHDGFIDAGMDADAAESFRSIAQQGRESALAAKAAEERAARKADFESRLSAINYAFQTDDRTRRTFHEMAEAGGDYYDNLDGLMNDVYSYLQDTLAPEQFANLQSEQVQWLDRRTAAMDAELDKFRNPKTGIPEGDGFSMSMNRSTAGCDMMKQRIPELINMIP